MSRQPTRVRGRGQLGGSLRWTGSDSSQLPASRFLTTTLWPNVHPRTSSGFGDERDGHGAELISHGIPGPSDATRWSDSNHPPLDVTRCPALSAGGGRCLRARHVPSRDTRRGSPSRSFSQRARQLNRLANATLVRPLHRLKHRHPPGPLAVLLGAIGEQTVPRAGEGSPAQVAGIFTMPGATPHTIPHPATTLSCSPLRQSTHSRRRGHDRENDSPYHGHPWG